MELYKIVGPAGEPLNGGSGAWPLPDGDKPGDWRTVDGPLEACRNGLHLATAEQLPNWLPTGREFVVYRAETDGELIDGGGKWVAAKVRLLPRSRPMPDLAKARALRDRKLVTARRAFERAVKRTAVDVSEPWQSYLSKVGTAKLPASHPGTPYQDRMAAVRTARDVAAGVKLAADTKAQAAYAATLRKGVMP